MRSLGNPQENTLQETFSDRDPDRDIDTDVHLSSLGDKEKFITTSKNDSEVQESPYAPREAQINSLQSQGLEFVPIAPDGDCLFNALIEMDIRPDNVSNANEFRRFIAERVTNEDSQYIPAQDMDRDAIANTIATPGSYDDEVGDITPSIIARELNVNIIIHNDDGTRTPINVPRSNQTIHLVRVRNPSNHYHATRSLK
ncbi:MAG: hypothetical protein RLP12_16955 [Ekhidna sp.]